jgi:D-beta-D-heptose 7-phosphate kinase/D-beta-D-heptose 1-phosphate adenosyltransferase
LIGDSCIDEYVYGTCKRLNPEAPVPILEYSRTETTKGMVWNVESNLRAFGINVILLTNEELLIKTRYIDEKYNHQILRLDKEIPIKPLSTSILNYEYDAIVISDYDKGYLPFNKIDEIVSQSNCPIFIDSKKTNLPYRKNCFLKINNIEYEKLEHYEPDNLIITKGSEGAEYKGVIYPAENVSVFDVVGAGDTFLAALVHFYLICGRIEEAIPYANKASAIAVQNFGTYVLSKEDVSVLCGY